MHNLLTKSVLFIMTGMIMFSTACAHHEDKIEAEEMTKAKVKVEVIKPQVNDYTEPFTISGLIKSHQEVVLSSQVVGQVIDIVVEEGNKVSRGQMLIKIDDRDIKVSMARLEAEAFQLQAKLEEQQNKLEELKNRIQMLFHDQERYLAEAELAQNTYDRYMKLCDQDIITPQELDEIKTELEKANAIVAKSQAEYNMMLTQRDQVQSQMKQVSAQLQENKAAFTELLVKESYTQIISPINGYVIKKFIEIGELAQPGKSLVSLENTDNLYMEINVEEGNVFLLQQGNQVEINIDVFPGSSVMGIVREIIPSADPDTHTFTVKVDLPAHELIKSGMYARVILPISGRNIFIPRTAIIRKGQITGVFVVDSDNIARFRIVKVGQEIQGFVEIISGLMDKDKVIISNLDETTDGTKVDVIGVR